ncbi:Patched domain-containing protein 3, partial [Lamellibrachia satsuma]
MKVPLNKLSFPVHTVEPRHGANITFFLGSTIGGVSKTPGGDTKAEAWTLFYYLRSDENQTEQHNLTVRKWQTEFLTTLAKKSYKHITVTRFTAHSLEDELKRNADAVIPLSSILFTILTIFSIVLCMSADWVRSKPWLATVGVLSAGLALVSGFGLVLHAGIPFIDIVASSPFLILGIGVDDMFVMLAAWRQTDFRLPVEERMGKAFSEAALSITITSLTDALSIGIGTITKFRSVRIFCTYTVIAVLFDYIYQITFFASCMVLTGRREASNRHSATCMKAVPKSLAGQRSAIFLFFCTGGYTEEEMEDNNNTTDVRAMAFFRDSWGGLLSTRPFKIFLLHVYLAYLTFAIWGCVNVKEGITLDRLAGDGSYVVDYYEQDIKYFREYGHVINVNVGKELPLWDKTERDKVEEVIQKFEDSEYFHGKDVTSAWTRDFTTFIGNDGVCSGNFSSILDDFLSKYSLLNYNMDIKTESDKVRYSRFFVYSKNIDTSIREGKMMTTAREIADNNQNLNVTVFHPLFIFYDQYLAVWPNTRQNLLIATAAMFVVSLLLIPHPVCSLWVTFSIVSISTGVIGYMTWWGVNLDSISMISIIICIGFCVDFSAHITYAFVLAEGKTGNQRMRNALHALGYPIAQGALSTILGVSVLAFSSSYIFRTFFKTMFLVISLGAFHGLLIIPALLSIM